MKETIDKFHGLPVVQNGYTATHINEYKAMKNIKPMSQWHFKRKPYTGGDAPLR